MARHNPTWSRRIASTPFTPAEDAELVQMVACGLSCDYYKLGLPHRTTGEILARRLHLIQSGTVQRARAI